MSEILKEDSIGMLTVGFCNKPNWFNFDRSHVTTLAEDPHIQLLNLPDHLRPATWKSVWHIREVSSFQMNPTL